MLHTVLAINFGALLMAFAPTLRAWAAAPTAVVPVEHGAWSWLLTACAAGVLAWSLRNANAAARHFRRATWRRRGLAQGSATGGRQVLVTGATGFIGRHLVYRLIARGDRVTVLARNRAKAEDLFGPHATIVENLGAIPSDARLDAIVNLAGEPIAARPWTAARRRELVASRLAVTSALLGLAGRLATRPRTWVNASAVGYYGVRPDDEPLHEKSEPQPVFQSELCRRWETAAGQAAKLGVKVALLRIGLVLGLDGGALPALARPVRLHLGLRFGDGAQWVSWIHVDDLVALILFVLDEEMLAGPVNATAPVPVRHAELMSAIAWALGRKLLPFGVPAWALRALLGELARLFVDGQRVIPARATALGFRFRYVTIEDALADLLRSRSATAVVGAVSARH